MALRLAQVILWSPSASPGFTRNDGSPPAVASGAASAAAWLGGEHLQGRSSCSGGSGSGSNYGWNSSRRSSCSNATCSGWTGNGGEGSFMFVSRMRAAGSLRNSGGGATASTRHLAGSGTAEGAQATAPCTSSWRKGMRAGSCRSCSVQRPNASSSQTPSGRVTKKVAGATAGAVQTSSSIAIVKYSVGGGLGCRWGEGSTFHSHLPAVGRTGPTPSSSSTVNGLRKRNSRRKNSLCRCEAPEADGGGGNSAGTATDGSSTTTTTTTDNGSAASTDSSVAPASKVTTSSSAAEKAVLSALAQIIDPDFGMDIVSCGFVKDLAIDEGTGHVSFRLELTTPACPIKDEFERQARDNVSSLDWVKDVNVTMSAQPPRPLIADSMPAGLRKVSNIIAVSSCKGGVGKSTVAVNLAYSLAMMGARVGIFDADVYGPSLPTMVNPEVRVLQMDPETKSIFPSEYEGVKIVSMGFAGQGSAIMRGPMVSGVINQLMTSTEWGELDYLVIDMPPGTGDIHLTLCQLVPLTAAVIVTTPQRLAFIDVVKGVRMFAKLKVPCVAVVENMCYFEAGGKRYFPFGEGSGQQVADMFGIPFLAQLPIRPELSASGDSGRPEVIADPVGEIARAFQEVGVAVVQECAKFRQQVATAVRYDPQLRAIVVKPPGEEEEFYLHPATVRRNDRSARSVDEWTGEQMLRYSDVMDNIEPEGIRPMGNYAVSISWPDGLTQVAPFDQLRELERLIDPYAQREALASSVLSPNSSERTGKPEEEDGEWEKVVEEEEETRKTAGDRAPAMAGEGEKLTGAQTILRSASGLQRERHAAQQD